MSFIAVPVTPTPAPVDESQPIPNAGFFPAVAPATVRDMQRIDGTVTPGRLRRAVLEGMAASNADLAAWADQQKSQGRMTLADVPADHIDGESVLIQRYLRAVAALANASLSERYRDFDATHEGHKEADKIERTIDQLRRDARWALRDILGIPRSTVELI